MIYVGAHVSAAGGTQNAIAHAEAIGADAIQIFGSSPRQWNARDIGPDEIRMFRAQMNRSGMGPVFFHAPYLINLSGPDAVLRAKSVKLLAANLRNAEALGIEGVIFHVGSRKELPWEQSRGFVIEAIRDILESTPGRARLVIENSAGGGNTVGSTLGEIADLISGVNSDRLGMCYDTAHGFESGIVDSYDRESVRKLAEDIDRAIGLKNLLAVHLNDSKTPNRSNSDRHENIGEGFIGLEGIGSFVRNESFRDVPWFLEVPGFDGTGPDKRNIDIVRALSSK